jgi:hypothetical protein
MDTQIAYQTGSQFIWALCTYTNSSQSDKGEFVQKFDKDTGARMLTETAKEVYAIGTENIHAGALQLKEDSPLFLLKSGIDNGVTPTTLGVVYLDDSGDFVWPEESRPVATFSANKSRIHYTKPVNNQSVAVFIEEKSVEPKIYAQNFIDELLGVDEYDESSTIFVNNPVSERLQIESELPLRSVQVFSLLGQQVVGENYLGSTKINIETESWMAGVYIVSIEAESGLIKEVRIIKE